MKTTVAAIHRTDILGDILFSASIEGPSDLVALFGVAPERACQIVGMRSAARYLQEELDQALKELIRGANDIILLRVGMDAERIAEARSAINCIA